MAKANILVQHNLMAGKYPLQRAWGHNNKTNMIDIIQIRNLFLCY